MFGIQDNRSGVLEMKKSNRGKVDPFIVMDVMEKARLEEEKGRSVIHMEVGQPSTPAPKGAIKELSSKLGVDALGYTVALGLPKLRQKISDLYQKWYNIDLNPDRVIVTSGSSGAFLLSFTALFDQGARVGIAAPGYPSYRQIMKSLDIEPVIIKATSEDDFQLTENSIRHQKLDGVLIASPANPTGSMLNFDTLSGIIERCQQDQIAFISDEIYHGIEYDKKAISALQITDSCYVINSFSKYFSMTGWRIGWMVVPESHIRQVERLAQNMFICAPHASQIAAVGALESFPEMEKNLEVYRINRNLMIKGLSKAGFRNMAPPDGAFYIYADISEFSDDSLEFSNDMLETVGVAVTPGLDFDSERGRNTVRFSYARSTKEIKEGIERISQFMKKRGYN